MRGTLVAALAALTLVACSSVSLPPKAGPEEVALIDPSAGQSPDEGYKVIGPVSVTAPMGTDRQELITLLLTQAAELGADAVLFEGIEAPQDLIGNTDREEGLTAKGRAIYYPTETVAN